MGAGGSRYRPAELGRGVLATPGNARQEARIKGYEGDACAECGQFTLVRNGACLKCESCGASSGCS